MTHATPRGPEGVARHPDDPEPVPATKARAVWLLGVVAVLTGPLLGGVVPGTLALLLAREFRRDAHRAGGFLTGAARVRQGERLAWAGILLAAAAVTVAVIVGMFQLAEGPTGTHFPANVD